jgi:hypothetical protein
MRPVFFFPKCFFLCWRWFAKPSYGTREGVAIAPIRLKIPIHVCKRITAGDDQRGGGDGPIQAVEASAAGGVRREAGCHAAERILVDPDGLDQVIRRFGPTDGDVVVANALGRVVPPNACRG